MADDGTVDLLVVGGGINGAGIARDAAGRGLSVVLCEQDDLAQHTSSASSKLIHGGLRYLEHYEFRLVREALREREVLLRAAPHLIWPLTFVLPHEPAMRSAWMVRLGLFLYDRLGGRRTLSGSRRIRLRDHVAGKPLREQFRTGFTYADCWVDDARLVAINAIDAAERGARILTRTRCTAARRANGLWYAQLEPGAGESLQIRGRALVNATGPWVSRFLSEEAGLEELKRVRLAKGSHIVTRRLFDHPHPYILQHTDRRIVFAMPYEGRYTLIGTTDQDFDGDPRAVQISVEEVEYLCKAVSRYFREPLRSDQVEWTYAGVRPLYDDARADVSTVTRDYAFDLDPGGEGDPPLLSVYGGKITTYRRLAEHALARLQPLLRFEGGPWTRDAHLPGGDVPDADFDAFLSELQMSRSWLPAALAQRYARAYGTRVERLLGEARSLRDLGEDLGEGLYEAEVDYLVGSEWARTDDDILWRRTKLGLHVGDQTVQRLGDWLERRGRTAALAV